MPKLMINPSQKIFNQLIDKAAETDGWAHQPYDYQFWRENFDNFWFFAMVDQDESDESNLMVGACLAQWNAPNGPPLFSIGLYYCVDKFRGLGYGSKIFKAIMEIVGDNEACLTGALDMVPKYAKNYGFDKIASYIHMHSTIKMEDLIIPNVLSDEVFTKNWQEVDPEDLEFYDLTICPRIRMKFMKIWFQMPEVYTKVAIDKSNKIQGYCTIRVVNLNRLCACPFYAENLETAERLLADTLRSIPNFKNYSEFFMWNPEINKDVEKLFTKFSTKFTMEPDFKTQFRKKFIEVPDEKVYSVADSTHQFV